VVPAAWISVPRGDGGEARRGTSLTRPAEASVIADELARLLDEHPGLTFGVIAFYSAQVELIWEQLGRRKLAEQEGGGWAPVARLRHGLDGAPLDRLRVGTVDAFQGMEFDVVYLSIVRSAKSGRPGTDRTSYGHLMSPNRLCVSMSRQRRLLVAVGDDAMFGPAAPAGVAPITSFLRLCGEVGVVLRP
jgi:superfamily I DNA and/or RNA helicase